MVTCSPKLLRLLNAGIIRVIHWSRTDSRALDKVIREPTLIPEVLDQVKQLADSIFLGVRAGINHPGFLISKFGQRMKHKTRKIAHGLG